MSVVAAARREAILRLKAPSPARSSPLPGFLQGAATLGVAASLLLAPPAVHAKTVSGLTSDVTVVGEHACKDACPCAMCPCAICPCAICPVAPSVSRVTGTGPCACTYPRAALLAHAPRHHLPMRSLPMCCLSHAPPSPCSMTALASSLRRNRHSSVRSWQSWRGRSRGFKAACCSASEYGGRGPNLSARSWQSTGIMASARSSAFPYRSYNALYLRTKSEAPSALLTCSPALLPPSDAAGIRAGACVSSPLTGLLRRQGRVS